MSLAGLVVVCSTLVAFGRLADLVGPRRVYAGLAAFGAGAGLSVAAPDMGWLVLAQAVQGLGWSMSVASGTALLVSVFEPAERSRAVAANHVAVAVGLAAGPAVGGVVIDQFGWRWGFAALAPPRWPSWRPSRWNTSLTLVVAVMAVYGVGAGCFQSPNFSAVIGSVAPERVGFASAGLATVGRLCQVVGVAVAGGLWQWGLDRHGELPAGQTAAFRLAFAVLAMVGVLAVLASWLRGPAEPAPGISATAGTGRIGVQ